MQVILAYLGGLEKLSVASFFVSRVDTLVDRLLDEKSAATLDVSQKHHMQSLKGKAAIANAKLAYQLYRSYFVEGSNVERFKALEAQGPTFWNRRASQPSKRHLKICCTRSMTNGEPWRGSNQSRGMCQPHVLPQATGIREELRVPTRHRLTRSLHSDEAVREGNMQATDARAEMSIHACTMSREEPHEKEPKALKLPAEKGVRHELYWYYHKRLQTAPTDHKKKRRNY